MPPRAVLLGGTGMLRSFPEPSPVLARRAWAPTGARHGRNSQTGRAPVTTCMKGPRHRRHDAWFLVEQFPVTRAIYGHARQRRLRLHPARFVVPPGSPADAQAEAHALARPAVALPGGGPVPRTEAARDTGDPRHTTAGPRIEDHSTSAPLSVRKTGTALGLLEDLLAIELVLARDLLAAAPARRSSAKAPARPCARSSRQLPPPTPIRTPFTAPCGTPPDPYAARHRETSPD